MRLRLYTSYTEIRGRVGGRGRCNVSTLPIRAIPPLACLIPVVVHTWHGFSLTVIRRQMLLSVVRRPRGIFSPPRCPQKQARELNARLWPVEARID